jgi:hypothetical protein
MAVWVFRAINQDSAGIPAVRVDGSKGNRSPVVNFDAHSSAGTPSSSL